MSAAVTRPGVTSGKSAVDSDPGVLDLLPFIGRLVFPTRIYPGPPGQSRKLDLHTSIVDYRVRLND